MLQLDSLAATTRPVFELMAQQAALENFVLVGGAAMALQMGHRLAPGLSLQQVYADFAQAVDALEIERATQVARLR
jgi:hypothetical protein